MPDTSAELMDKLRWKLQLPPDTPAANVLAASNVECTRRAGRVGLPWDATYEQIEVAEQAQVKAAAARRVAAAAMLGHPVTAQPPAEDVHPALAPVSGRVPLSTSRCIDWGAALAGDESAA